MEANSSRHVFTKKICYTVKFYHVTSESCHVISYHNTSCHDICSCSVVYVLFCFVVICYVALLHYVML